MIPGKLSIRFKITLSNIVLLAVVSLLLYVGSNRFANEAIESIPMTQLIVQNGGAVAEGQSDSISGQIPASPMKDAKKTYRSAMNFYVIGTILLGGLITFIIAKRALKPLEDFEQSMRNTDPRHLTEKIVVSCTEPEITCLVDTFNEMMDKLDQSFVLQKQFSHSVAHELRTPLTVLRTKIEVFQKKNRTPEEYQTLLNLVQTYTQNLSNMVEDILQYSNLSEIPLEEEIALEEILREVVTEIHDLYPDRSIRLKPGGLSCKGNEVLLHRVFFNLVENACRYGQDGDIHIHMERQDQWAAVRISDSGPGIADGDKLHLFEPFFRVDKSRSKEFGGVGLGLFFCREIVSRHGGSISVCDNRPCGAVFTVALPA